MALRLIRALPGERRFLSPLPRQHRPAWIDATVAAPGPHDFAVRCGRFVGHAFTHLTPQRPSQPAPTSVTIARRPLLRARADCKIVLICGNVKPKVLIFGIAGGIPNQLEIVRKIRLQPASPPPTRSRRWGHLYAES